MKKILRYLFLGLFVGIVFLVATVAIFAIYFDPNAYKQDLSDLVLEQTGRELRFDGDVEMTIYPALGVRLGAMQFANAEGFGERPMIRVGEASVSVDVLSLLRLAPEIDKLVLRDLEINLIRNKAGVNNWDDLLPPPDDETAAGGDSGGKGGARDGEFAIEGAFGGLELENVRLLWLDEQAGTRQEITDLDATTGRIVPNGKFPMTLNVAASAGDDVLISLDLASDVEYLIEQQRLTLSDLTLRLNEFEISGMLQLADFSRPTPSLRFDLVSNDLDVDALLGTPPADPAGPLASGDGDGKQGDGDQKIELPTQTLRDLDIDGKIAFAQIKAQNLRMQNVQLPIRAQNGLVGIKPLTMDLYQGKVETSVVIDVREDLPRYGIDEKLRAVQVGPLLEDYSGEARISGRLDAEANLTTSGEWVSDLRRNSNGTLALAFTDGALNGFNIRQSIENAKTKLSGGDPPDDKILKTDFSSLTLSGVVRNGVFSSDDLDLQAPLLRAGGRGKADLNRETVDYLVEAKLVGTVEGQQGKSADELAGLPIPVLVKGPFRNPKIDVQLDEMLKAKADAEKERLKAEIEAEKQKLQQEIEEQKKKLEESKKRELQKQLEVEESKAKKKLEDKLKKLLE